MEHALMECFPGISCAWSAAEEHVRTACCGMADRERGVPADESTIFPACSISKFVAAVCVMKLHEQGVIDVDEPVNAYLRGWKLRAPGGQESDASVRALLCHTAGIVDGEDSFYGLRRSDPPIGLTDLLDGHTSYNNRPVRAENPQGTAFEYSDAGYCVLQYMAETVTGKPFAEMARELVFAPLQLKNTFFASPENIACFEQQMAAGYDEEFAPIPGRFPACPDLAASGLWSTPAELLTIGRAFLASIGGRNGLLQEDAALQMAAPVPRFPWTGLGLFTHGSGILMTQGWGENGQCMMKMNRCTGRIAVVMTNRNPGVAQEESGVQRLVDRLLETEV